MAKIYLFDVDETLEISGGPVTFQSIIDLKAQGNIVGLCGNWGLITRNTRGWENLFSLINIGAEKVAFMQHILRYIPAEDYIMVGNRKGGLSPDDEELTRLAGGWRFIAEKDFAAGSR